MKWTHNLNIGTRLILLVCFTFVVSLAVIFAGMLNNKRLSDDTQLDYQAIIRPLTAIAGAQGKLGAMCSAFYGLERNFNSDEEIRLFKQQLKQNLKEYERNIKLYKDILVTYGTNDPVETNAVARLHEQLEPLSLCVKQLSEFGEQTGNDTIVDTVSQNMSRDFWSVTNDISINLMLLTEILETQTNDANKLAENLQIHSNTVSAIIMLSGAAILLLGAYAIVISITRPLKEMTEVAEKVSGGELDVDIGYRSDNELGVLADSFRNMVAGIKIYLNDKLQAERSSYEADLEKIELIDNVHYENVMNEDLE